MSRINPLKVLMKKAGFLNDRLAKWSILLSCYDIRYTLAKAIKGQALTDFLAEHLLDEDLEFKDDISGKPVFFTEKIVKHSVDPDLHWIKHFDGATRTNEFGEIVSTVGIIFYSSERIYIPRSFSLLEPYSNNAAEYTALIMGFELVLESGVDILVVYGVYKLIIKQMNLEYEVRKPNLVPYFSKAQKLKS